VRSVERGAGRDARRDERGNATDRNTLEVDGRRLTVSSLDRVYYPQVGTTKAELLRYYIDVSPVMLPHLRERLLHMHRYPEGVRGPRFWQKACPEHHPAWMATAPVWSRDKDAHIEYCVVNELAGLLWAVNLGSLELHTSLHHRGDLHRPSAIAFDLDPGPGTGLLDCCEVALRLRVLLRELGLAAFPKTSGSKGLQVYVPLNTPSAAYAQTKAFARGVAQLLEAQTPDRVVSRMARSLRTGHVLIDWSQNTEHKSMVCAYSARARDRPTVSTPLRWEEIEAASDPAMLVFDIDTVRERLAAHGDLFEPVLELRQELPLGVLVKPG
jgi:bifunctional non-homologous end joining protein LigD